MCCYSLVFWNSNTAKSFPPFLDGTNGIFSCMVTKRSTLVTKPTQTIICDLCLITCGWGWTIKYFTCCVCEVLMFLLALRASDISWQIPVRLEQWGISVDFCRTEAEAEAYLLDYSTVTSHFSLFFCLKGGFISSFAFLSSHRGENQTSTLVAPSVWRCNLD